MTATEHLTDNADQLDAIVANFAAAIDSTMNAVAAARDALGHNRPMTSGQQAHVMGAAADLIAAMLRYQMAQLEQWGGLIPLATLADLDADEQLVWDRTEHDDPLAAFRCADDEVAYTTRLAGTVAEGEWVQACAGDGPDEWRHVTHVVRSESSVGFADLDRLRWWGHMDPIRVACTPGEAVARQGGVER